MAEPVLLNPTRPCPICGKPATMEHQPFCSTRCQDIDLNRWLSDTYRIPTKEEPDVPPDQTGEDED